MLRVYILSSPRHLRATDVGVILWPSFLAACAASLLFFAAVDPLLLRDAGPRVFAGLERETGYAVGFLFFWLTAAIASTLSVWLLRSASSRAASERPLSENPP